MSGEGARPPIVPGPAGRGGPGSPHTRSPQGPAGGIGPPRRGSGGSSAAFSAGAAGRPSPAIPVPCLASQWCSRLPAPLPGLTCGGKGAWDTLILLGTRSRHILARIWRNFTVSFAASSSGVWGVPWFQSWSLVQQLHRSKRGLPMKPGV